MHRLILLALACLHTHFTDGFAIELSVASFGEVFPLQHHKSRLGAAGSKPPK